MRTLPSLLLMACGAAPAPAPGGADLELVVVAQVDPATRQMQGLEASLAPLRPPPRRLPRDCRAEGTGGLGPMAPTTLELQAGLDLHLGASDGRWSASISAPGPDPTFLPVDLTGAPVEPASEEAPAAARFGDMIVVTAIEEVPGGGRKISWQGPYGDRDVEVRVRQGRMDLYCPSVDGHVHLPAWVDLKADHALVGWRDQLRRTASGALLLGRAGLAVPLRVTVDQAEAEMQPGSRDLRRTGPSRSWWRHSGQVYRVELPT